MSILVLVDHNNQKISEVTLSTLTSAQRLAEKSNQKVHLLVSGYQCQAVVDACSIISGVDTVFHADNEVLAHQLPENLAPLLVDIVSKQKITHLVSSSTTVAKNVMPRVAALLDVGQVSEIVAIVEQDTFVRPIYAGNALATIKTTDAVKVITVRTSAFSPAGTDPVTNAANIVTIPDVVDVGLSTFINEELSESDRPELATAKIVVSGGRGLKSKENFSLLEGLAEKLGAALGASRAAVDAGYVPNELQVGQTGKIISPDLYIAVGISGAIQHLAGMKDSKIIVAINKDEEAPIFNVADYGLVGDLFDILPALSAELG